MAATMSSMTDGITFLDDPGQTVDAGVPCPHGNPCPNCGAPVEPMDHFCNACGSRRDSDRSPVEPEIDEASTDPSQAPLALDAQRETEPKKRAFRCQQCGSEVTIDLDQRSYVCAFCDSTYVVEIPQQESGRQRPEFVIGFSVTPQQALQKYRTWIRANSWFRPGDLHTAQIEEKLKGVYLPFWMYSLLAESQWAASIGEYWYKTETYRTKDSKGRTVTRTRRVQHTEWWPLRGRHHAYYNSYVVSGSCGLAQSEAERIKPFQLPALKRYEPYFLAGWFAEEYSVGRDEALQRCQTEFYRREQVKIAAFMPGDRHRELRVHTTFRDIHSDLCLLPIYILSYRYRDKVYRFLVNGQTGKCAGDKPTSPARIGGALAGILLLLLVIILVFYLFNTLG